MTAFYWIAATFGVLASGLVTVAAAAPDARPLNSWFLNSSPTDWILVVIGSLTAVAAMRTLDAILRQVKANEDAVKAAADNAAAASANAAAAEKSARLAAENLQTLQIIERAYVDLSHSPPGLSDVSPNRAPQIEICVTNYGRTPADVLRVAVGLFFAGGWQLPEEPEFNRMAIPITPSRFFLMPGQTIRLLERFDSLPAHIVTPIDTGEQHLFVIGYVEYIDRFGRRYRNGYARRYIPKLKSTNNLVFVAQPGYHDDTER